MSRSTKLLTPLKKFTQQQPRLTAALKLVVKLGLSALALAIVFRQIDWATTLQLASRVPWYFLVAAWALYNLSKVVSALRLQRILAVLGISLPTAYNLRLYYQGMFYNLFLPGGIGGDGYKAIVLREKTKAPLRQVIVGLLLDRISGVVALLILALVFLMMTSGVLPNHFYTLAGIALLAAIPAWIGFLYLFFRDSLSIFTPSLVLSLAVQGIQVIQAWVLLAALQVETGWIEYSLVFLLSSLATLFPVTIGGLGARELVFVFAAQYLGISQEVAVTFSLLFFLINVASSLLGVFIKNPIPATAEH
jgi:uncharacterized membrane protein YbhN (UPF0104 family)